MGVAQCVSGGCAEGWGGVGWWAYTDYSVDIFDHPNRGDVDFTREFYPAIFTPTFVVVVLLLLLLVQTKSSRT